MNAPRLGRSEYPPSSPLHVGSGPSPAAIAARQPTPTHRRTHDATRRWLVALPQIVPRASPGAGRAAGHVRETQVFVVRQRMLRRSVAGRQRPTREALEVGNARIAPPGGFLLL